VTARSRAVLSSPWSEGSDLAVETRSARAELTADVTKAAGLGEPARVALTVHLPNPTPTHAEPVVCFAKPGAGYSRGYFTVDLPGPAKGAQAEWHAARGWIFVSVDHLGVGESSQHAPEKLDFSTVAAASRAAEQEVLRRLAKGSLAPGFPAVRNPVRIGIGQSMGGCLTVVQQGRYHGYDGIAVLGYGAVRTDLPARPGMPPLVLPWLVRDPLLGEPLAVLNTAALAEASTEPLAKFGSTIAWALHYDDIDPAIVERDLARYDAGLATGAAQHNRDAPPWASLTLPGTVAQACITPGTIAPDAAAVRVAGGDGRARRDPRPARRAARLPLRPLG